MLRKWSSFLLATLIALQSVIAIADAHQFHQTGQKHLEFNHQHTEPQNQQLDQQEQDTTDNMDCHHCCH